MDKYYTCVFKHVWRDIDKCSALKDVPTPKTCRDCSFYKPKDTYCLEWNTKFLKKR